jgi:hypothetical protein
MHLTSDVAGRRAPGGSLIALAMGVAAAELAHRPVAIGASAQPAPGIAQMGDLRPK